MNHATQWTCMTTTGGGALGVAIIAPELDVVVIPTWDGDRAHEFCGRLDWRLDTRGECEERTEQHDANWPERYGAYMVAEQAGEETLQ